MHTSTGKLNYGKGWRLALDVDPGIGAYYRSLIPKHIKWNIPRYYPHITVVRDKYETPPKPEKWMAYQGHKIRFEYDPYIHIDDTYIWLSCFCKKLEEIRLELGLNRCRDRFKWFHLTIANRKNT